MGCKAMYALMEIAEGNAVEYTIHTGLDVCDNDNIDSCVQ